MRVLVVGGGGREAAIAWACRRHGHEVIQAPDLGEAGPSAIDLVVPGPEARPGCGHRRRVRPARTAVLRSDGRARPARVVEVVRPVARHRARCPGSPLRPLQRCRRRGRVVASARGSGRGQTRRAGGRQGRRRPRRRSGHRTSDRRGGRGRVVPARGAHARSGMHAARTVRRDDGARPPPRPGPQTDRRGRHGAEHGRHGRLRPGTRPVRGRRAGRHVRAAGGRPLPRRRHAVRGRHLRRADAHHRRAATRRVQRPLRRSGDAGGAPPRRERPGRVAAGVHARAGARGHRHLGPRRREPHGRRRGSGLSRRTGDAAP